MTLSIIFLIVGIVGCITFLLMVFDVINMTQNNMGIVIIASMLLISVFTLFVPCLISEKQKETITSIIIVNDKYKFYTKDKEFTLKSDEVIDTIRISDKNELEYHYHPYQLLIPEEIDTIYITDETAKKLNINIQIIKPDE